MNHFAWLSLALALAWWLLSGHGGVLLPALGLGSVLLVLGLSWRMDRIDGERRALRPSLRLPVFVAWLLREVALANLQVVRLILSPRPALSPSVFRVGTRQTSELGKVVLGNSITLTPGTVTIDIEGDVLLVHALTEASAEDVRAGSIDRRIPAGLDG